MRKSLFSTVSSIQRIFQRFFLNPYSVLLFCLSVIFFKLILQGQLYVLWSLYQDKRQINYRMARMQQEADKLQMQIEQVQDPRVLELEARDKLDLVHKGDLVFVFTDADDGVGKVNDNYKANPWSD